ncbi:hypothetical protein CGCTS75_v003788 [Colletotrichum tropicale]|nr:hypothetical protein CGCTS75_v003788 [Colletotrichum tropicale]
MPPLTTAAMRALD